jgi:tetratricopeptide (TPR) repeat protein
MTTITPGDDSEDPFVLRDRAVAAQSKGRIRDAVALLRRAIEAVPDSPDLHHDLGAAFEEMGEFANAVESYQEAIELKPDYAEAMNNLGNALLGLRREADAFAAYRRAEAVAPDSPSVQINIANRLELEGQIDEAIRRYRRAMELGPRLTIAHFPLARTLLAAGEPEQALAMVDRCLELNSRVQGAIALKGLLLQELGRPDEARQVVDLDRFLKVFHPPPPDGYASMAAFHRELIEHAENHPTLVFELYGSSTHNGRHSFNLLWDEAKPAQALKAMLQAVYAEYVDMLIADAPNPLLLDPMPAFRVQAQAQLLNSGGYLEPHVHPDGWLSGAYYVQIPEALRDSATQAGWIEFGRPPPHVRITVEPETRTLEPEEGTVVLFPSYFFHGVKPFESPDLRISLGTDMIPIAAGRA